MRCHVYAVGVGMLSLAVLAGGCVPRSEYDKLMAANRRVNLELDQANEALRQCSLEKQQIQDEMGRAQGLSQTKQADITLLEQKNAEWERKYEALNEAYRKAVESAQPPSLGPITLTALPAQVNQALEAFADANPGLVEYMPDYGMVKLKSDLTFQPGSDYPRAEAQAALQKFAAILNSPEANQFNVFVAGHTDDIPVGKPETKRRHPDNWYLSVHRAVAVQQVLGKVGVAPARICAMGFGEYHPIAPNKPGNKGNEQNRRVELWIVPADRFVTPMEAGG